MVCTFDFPSGTRYFIVHVHDLSSILGTAGTVAFGQAFTSEHNRMCVSQVISPHHYLAKGVSWSRIKSDSDYGVVYTHSSSVVVCCCVPRECRSVYWYFVLLHMCSSDRIRVSFFFLVAVSCLYSWQERDVPWTEWGKAVVTYSIRSTYHDGRLRPRQRRVESLKIKRMATTEGSPACL